MAEMGFEPGCSNSTMLPACLPPQAHNTSVCYLVRKHSRCWLLYQAQGNLLDLLWEPISCLSLLIYLQAPRQTSREPGGQELQFKKFHLLSIKTSVHFPGKVRISWLTRIEACVVAWPALSFSWIYPSGKCACVVLCPYSLKSLCIEMQPN